MKRYKVFKEIDGELVSVYAEGDLMGEYKEGRWRSPNRKAIEKGYGCLVFTSLVRALTMLESDCRIARVHCRGQMRLPKKLSMHEGKWFDLNKLLSMLGMCDNTDRRGWPPNTEMFEKVKIVELLDVEATKTIRAGCSIHGLSLYTDGIIKEWEVRAVRAWSGL